MSRKKNVLRWVGGCLSASLLSACASETPYYDATFGQATDRAYLAQTVTGNRADPSMQMDARALHNSMNNYMGDRQAPQAIQGPTGGLSGGSGQ